jgi:hypothetical protein
MQHWSSLFLSSLPTHRCGRPRRYVDGWGHRHWATLIDGEHGHRVPKGPAQRHTTTIVHRWAPRQGQGPIARQSRGGKDTPGGPYGLQGLGGRAGGPPAGAVVACDLEHVKAWRVCGAEVCVWGGGGEEWEGGGRRRRLRKGTRILCALLTEDQVTSHAATGRVTHRGRGVHPSQASKPLTPTGGGGCLGGPQEGLTPSTLRPLLQPLLLLTHLKRDGRAVPAGQVLCDIG